MSGGWPQPFVQDALRREAVFMTAQASRLLSLREAETETYISALIDAGDSEINSERSGANGPAH